MTPQENSQPMEERFEAMQKETLQLRALTESHLEMMRRAPEMEAAREAALLPKFAILATRVRAVEEGFHQLSGVVVETYDLVRVLMERQSELLALIQSRLEGLGGKK